MNVGLQIVLIADFLTIFPTKESHHAWKKAKLAILAPKFHIQGLYQQDPKEGVDKKNTFSDIENKKFGLQFCYDSFTGWQFFHFRPIAASGWGQKCWATWMLKFQYPCTIHHKYIIFFNNWKFVNLRCWNDSKWHVSCLCTFEFVSSICIYNGTFRSTVQHGQTCIGAHRPIGKRPHCSNDIGHENPQ